jgi:hypothetical protein
LESDTKANIEEVRVGDAPLPHPGSADDRVVPLWFAVDEKLTSALLLHSALNFIAILIKLA